MGGHLRPEGVCHRHAGLILPLKRDGVSTRDRSLFKCKRRIHTHKGRLVRTNHSGRLTQMTEGLPFRRVTSSMSLCADAAGQRPGRELVGVISVEV